MKNDNTDAVPQTTKILSGYSQVHLLQYYLLVPVFKCSGYKTATSNNICWYGRTSI